MWYFLRTLWEEDGLTQRELSRRAGTMEPTTLQQLRSMEAMGLIQRERSAADRRKIHVRLTPRGKRLEAQLIPYAREVNAAALKGLRRSEINELRRLLAHIRGQLATRHQSRVRK